MSGYVGSKRSSSLVSFDEGTIGSGVVFPAGHVLRVFGNTYVPSSDFGIGTTGTTISDLELSITNPSTNNFLVIHTNFIGYNNAAQNERLHTQIRYSTDNFSTETTLQTGAGGVGRTYAASGAVMLITTLSYVNYVNHPTTSDYKIRPYGFAGVGTFYLSGGSIHSIVAYEIKG